MDAHGGLPPLLSRFGKSATIGVGQESLRRVLTTTLEAVTTYQGLPGDPKLTLAMLSRLAKAMQSAGYPWPVGGVWTTEDNDAIPAGYTYLAQLVAHDFVQNTAQLPMISAFPGQLQRDYRTQRLVLDTLYGGGPNKDPLPYAVATNGSADRCLFRLGHVRGQEPQPFEQNPPPPLMNQAARDIPRARCPHLSDLPNARVAPDALIADPRNDQHLIISQLTAFFHELHNIILKKVRALQVAPSAQLVEQLNLPQRSDYPPDATYDGTFKQSQDDMAFLQTRKLVAYVYRRIVVRDLLKKLLEPGVFAYYTDPARNFPADLYDPKEDNRVPVEFSHAVFRFGHVMSRFSYKLNDKLDSNPSIKNLLDRSSAKRRDLLPLASNWLLDWSHFFDLGDGKVVNRSRRISPYVAAGPLATDAAVPEERDRGGLFYRDFVRGYEAGVSSVDALIAKLGAKRPSERDRSDLLKDANLREHELGQWLTYAMTTANIHFEPEELVSLSKDPPLLFFILFESAYTQGGQRLGILGSTLVADVFFAALKLNQGVIEDDPAVPVLAREIFGAVIPNSMPALIAYVKAQGGLAEVVFDPAAPV
jgi:hypothetical protein